MVKNVLLRIINSFMYAIGITTVVYIIVIMISGQTPLLPDYARKFDSDVKALLVQLILVGAMSAALGGGTIIMEFERLGLLAQSAVYFVRMASCGEFLLVYNEVSAGIRVCDCKLHGFIYCVLGNPVQDM